MNTTEIGITVDQVIAGTKCLYFPWIDRQHNTHADPKLVVIRHTQVWQVGREWVCSVIGVKGMVSIKHLKLIDG